MRMHTATAIGTALAAAAALTVAAPAAALATAGCRSWRTQIDLFGSASLGGR